MAAPSGAGRRRELIMQQLERDNVDHVAERSLAFGISEVSIQCDLERLERNGLLKRVHGGAVALAARSAGQQSIGPGATRGGKAVDRPSGGSPRSTG